MHASHVLAALTAVALACSPRPQAPPEPGPDAPAPPQHADAPQAEAPAHEATVTSNAPLPDRDPKLAHRLVTQEGALLLDVRTPAEFAEGHLPGAVNIPHDEVPTRVDEVLKLQGQDRNKPIVVHCKSGRRSGAAKQSLVDAGFTQVTNLGGMSDWCDDC